LHVLLYLIAIVIFPFTVSVIGIEIVLNWWDEWRWHPVVQQIIPFEVSKPRMILHIFWTIQSQPIQGFSLQKSVNEICSFDRPVLWYLRFLNLYLFGQDMLSYFFSSTSSVWPPSEHALVSDDTHSEIVDSDSMGLFTHDFGCHITGCARSVL
jgi:hypothetical protein